MTPKKPIGIYDSGVGGLTVLKELRARFPHEDFVYFGDTANVPYGDKTKDQIHHFSHSIADWLAQEKRAKLVVAACHTSSALVLDEVEKEVSVPVIGTIKPVLPRIAALKPETHLGIIATPASAAQGTHGKLFSAAGFKGKIHTVACPDFVPLVEAGLTQSEQMEVAVREYISGISFDTLFFGCTHYPYIQPVIEKLCPSIQTYIDPAEAIAQEVADLLSKESMSSDPEQKGRVDFYCSGDSQAFKQKLIALGFEAPLVVCQKVAATPGMSKVA